MVGKSENTFQEHPAPPLRVLNPKNVKIDFGEIFRRIRPTHERVCLNTADYNMFLHIMLQFRPRVQNTAN